MRIQTIAILYVSLVAGLVSSAQGIPVPTVFPQQPFTELRDCRNFYQVSVAPGSTNITDADTYCSYSTRIMSIDNFCRGQVVFLGRNFQDCVLALNARASTAASAVASTQIADAAQAAASTQQAQAAAAAQAQAAAAATAQAQAASTDATGVSGGASSAQMWGQLLPAITPAISAMGSGSGSGSPTPTSAAPLALSDFNPTTPRAPAAEVAAAPAAPPPVPAAPAPAAPAPETPAAPVAAAPDVTAPPPATPADTPAAEVTGNSVSVDHLPGQAAQAGQDVNTANNNAENLANSSSSDITRSTEEQNDILLRDLQNIVNNSRSLTQGPDGEAWQQVVAKLESIQQNVRGQYVETAKKSCNTQAERAEFLCVEGSSPGAKAVRTLLNLSGPILAIVNSAQKACSQTSDVMDFASKALTIAKGACVAAKIMCDGGCSKALKKVEDFRADVNTITGIVNTSATQGMGLCARLTAPPAISACEADNRRKQGMAIQYPGQINQLLNRESNAGTLGTTAGLAKKCEDKLVDIAAFAGNILSLVTAKNSADDCKENLAAGGTGTNPNASATQYCEQTTNYQTQFCQCQRNPQQEGCPGYVMGPGAGSNGNDLAGTNIRGSAGLSNFAGGSKGLTAPGVGSITGGADGNASGESSFTGAAGSGTGEGQYPMIGSTGGGGALAGNATTGEAAPKAKPEEKDKKKWDFGSFAGGVAGAFGLGKGKSSENGKVNNPQDDAIQRKVASEKLAGEISAASGKSNWEKVRDRYLIKSDTLLGQ